MIAHPWTRSARGFSRLRWGWSAFSCKKRRGYRLITWGFMLRSSSIPIASRNPFRDSPGTFCQNRSQRPILPRAGKDKADQISLGFNGLVTALNTRDLTAVACCSEAVLSLRYCLGTIEPGWRLCSRTHSAHKASPSSATKRETYARRCLLEWAPGTPTLLP